MTFLVFQQWQTHLAIWQDEPDQPSVHVGDEHLLLGIVPNHQIEQERLHIICLGPGVGR